MRKIGILGGTFNPVHFGHLRIALECKQELALDELRMIPCALPPHRDVPDVSATQRLQMLELAIASSDEFILDPRELRRAGPSYSVDTLESLNADFPDNALFMIIGSDAFQSLNTWHQWERIPDLCHIVVAQRPDNVLNKNGTVGQLLKHRFVRYLSDLQNARNGFVIPVNVSQLEISSTHIRKLIHQGQSPQYLLPDNVMQYIFENALYN